MAVGNRDSKGSVEMGCHSAESSKAPCSCKKCMVSAFSLLQGNFNFPSLCSGVFLSPRLKVSWIRRTSLPGLDKHRAGSSRGAINYQTLFVHTVASSVSLQLFSHGFPPASIKLTPWTNDNSNVSSCLLCPLVTLDSPHSHCSSSSFGYFRQLFSPNRPEGLHGWNFSSSNVREVLVLPNSISLQVEHQFQQQRLEELTPAHTPMCPHGCTLKPSSCRN